MMSFLSPCEDPSNSIFDKLKVGQRGLRQL